MELSLALIHPNVSIRVQMDEVMQWMDMGIVYVASIWDAHTHTRTHSFLVLMVAIEAAAATAAVMHVRWLPW